MILEGVLPSEPLHSLADRCSPFQENYNTFVRPPATCRHAHATGFGARSDGASRSDAGCRGRAGQYGHHYIAFSLQMWRQGIRKNGRDPMTVLAKNLDDQEIAAATSYHQEIQSTFEAGEVPPQGTTENGISPEDISPSIDRVSQ